VIPVKWPSRRRRSYLELLDLGQPLTVRAGHAVHAHAPRRPARPGPQRLASGREARGGLGPAQFHIHTPLRRPRAAQRRLIAIKTKIRLPNALPIVLNCAIGIINWVYVYHTCFFSHRHIQKT